MMLTRTKRNREEFLSLLRIFQLLSERTSVVAHQDKETGRANMAKQDSGSPTILGSSFIQQHASKASSQEAQENPVAMTARVT